MRGKLRFMLSSIFFTDGLKLGGSPLASGGARRDKFRKLGAEGAWHLQA